jgi:hypothetical protein
MGIFARTCTSGILQSGQVANLPVIPRSFWQKGIWLVDNAQLGNRPPVGGPNGIQHANPNDRVMESFGTSDYPTPLMAVDQMINGPKGRIMGGGVATDLRRIERMANDAVLYDAEGLADELLQSIRIVSCYASDVTLN